MITREYLENRMREFVVARNKHTADVEANNGAIQFCQHLLDNMIKEAPPGELVDWVGPPKAQTGDGEKQPEDAVADPMRPAS